MHNMVRMRMGSRTQLRVYVHVKWQLTVSDMQKKLIGSRLFLRKYPVEIP
jgi:hypothetical protein